MNNLEDLFGDNNHFQHAGDDVLPMLGSYRGKSLPPYQLVPNNSATARDTVMTHFSTKGYADPVLAGECILMGIVYGCSALRKVCFRGSEGTETATLLNVKTGAPALDADGNQIAVNKCILEAGETAGAWPATDVYLARIDCPTTDQDGALSGIQLMGGASGEAACDSFEGRAAGATPGNSAWAIIAIPSADVPDLASLWIDVEIANGMAL